MSASNGVGEGQAQRYQAFVENLQQGNPADMLLKQQEESAASSEPAMSSLGLLTMISIMKRNWDGASSSYPLTTAMPDGYNQCCSDSQQHPRSSGVRNINGEPFEVRLGGQFHRLFQAISPPERDGGLRAHSRYAQGNVNRPGRADCAGPKR